MNERQRLASLRPVIERNDALMDALRAFFHTRGFIEVATPVRLAAPATELHIDAEPSGPGFLRTSPELHMKRLLAAGYDRIFQIGPCFRRGELGRLHRPEFTMLEWYRTGAGYRDILGDALSLLAHVSESILDRAWTLGDGTRMKMTPEIRTVESAFLKWAGWNPFDVFDADRFNLDMAEKIEPNMPRDRPCVLMDYPEEAAAMARVRPGNPPVAERWELYAGGIELANAFSELTDAAEQRRRFQAWRDERLKSGLAVYPEDIPFLEALDAGLPDCAGAALGTDRLLMLLSGAESLDETLPF